MEGLICVRKVIIERLPTRDRIRVTTRIALTLVATRKFVR